MIILFVGQNIADVQLLPVEVDRSNKSELVATKIEHEVSPDFVDGVDLIFGRWKISQFEIIFKITSRFLRRSLASLLLLRSQLSDNSLPA